MCDPVHALNEVAMEHQFFVRQQNLKLYRSLVAASEAAAAKADDQQMAFPITSGNHPVSTAVVAFS
jgi:hypothetical protein